MVEMANTKIFIKYFINVKVIKFLMIYNKIISIIGLNKD